MFWSHILEGANQYSLKESDPVRQPDGHNFGSIPHIMRTKNIFIKIEKSLLEDNALPLNEKQQQRFTILMNKLNTKSSLSSNGRQSGGGAIFSESMEELNPESNKSFNENNEDATIKKQITKDKDKDKDKDKLEKIDEVSEARDSLISRTESMHMTNRRGTGFLESISLQKINNINNNINSSNRKPSDFFENEDRRKSSSGTNNTSSNNNLNVNEDKSDKKNSIMIMGEIEEDKLEEIEEEKTNDVILVEDIENEEKIKQLLGKPDKGEKNKKQDASFDSYTKISKELKSLEEVASLNKMSNNLDTLSINSIINSERDKSNINLLSEEKFKEKSFRSKKQETIDSESLRSNYREDRTGIHEMHINPQSETVKHKVVQRMMEKQQQHKKKEEPQSSPPEIKKWTTIVHEPTGEDKNLNYKSVINFYSKTKHNKYYSFN